MPPQPPHGHIPSVEAMRPHQLTTTSPPTQNPLSPGYNAPSGTEPLLQQANHHTSTSTDHERLAVNPTTSTKPFIPTSKGSLFERVMWETSQSLQSAFAPSPPAPPLPAGSSESPGPLTMEQAHSPSNPTLQAAVSGPISRGKDTQATSMGEYDIIRQFFQNATRSSLPTMSTLEDIFINQSQYDTTGVGRTMAEVTLEEQGVTWPSWDYNLTLANLSATSDNLTGIASTGADGIIASVFAGIALGTICIMTIGGNVLVLMAVFVNAHLRSTTNYFIVNLAIADLLLGTTVLPFSASLEIVNYWAFGQIFCDIWAAVDVLCCTASIMSLCVISIDRYIGVTRPLQHSTIMTEKRALYIIVSVWALAIAISVAPLLGWKEPPPDDPTVCEVTKQLGYVLFSVSGSFYIPLVIILVVYFRVYREAMSQSRFLSTGVKVSKTDESNSEVTLRIHTGRPVPNAKGAQYQSSSSSEHSEGSGKKNHSKLTMAGKVAKFKREKKAAKTLGIVVGVFILCWFPFFFILPLEALCDSCRIPEWLFKFMFWLGYCNSLMNPIIYACSSREFKRAFTRILRCKWRRKPRTFIDDLSHSAPSTEMSGLSRFASVRRFSFRNKKTETLKRTYSYNVGGAGRRFLLQATNGRTRLERESPIASLRLLHDQQRHDVMDHAPGDGDSTDDERSEASNEDRCDSAGHLIEANTGCELGANRPGQQPEVDPHLPATEYHVTSRPTNRKRQNYRADQRGPIPDIIVDEAEMEPLTVSVEAQEKVEPRFVTQVDIDSVSHFSNAVENPNRNMAPSGNTNHLPSDVVEEAQSVLGQSDNIMWL